MTISRDLADRGHSNSNPNILINGGLQVWQRSFNKTDPDSTSEYATADRWRARRANYRSMTVGTSSISGGIKEGFKRGIYVRRPNGDTYTNDEIVLVQQLEYLDVYPLRGKYLTLSFSMSQDAAGIAASMDRTLEIVSGTTADESINSVTLNLTGAVTLLDTTIPTPSVADTYEDHVFTTTVVVPSDAQNLVLQFRLNPLATATADETTRFSAIKLEEGKVATPFIKRPYADELALCQRYYQMITDYYTRTPANGSVTAWTPRIEFPVQMRTAPTMGGTNLQLGNCTTNNGWFHTDVDGTTYDVETTATTNTAKVQFDTVTADAEL